MSQPSTPRSPSPNSSSAANTTNNAFTESTSQSQSQSGGYNSSFREGVTQRVSSRTRAVPPRTPKLNLRSPQPQAPTKPKPIPKSQPPQTSKPEPTQPKQPLTKAAPTAPATIQPTNPPQSPTTSPKSTAPESAIAPSPSPQPAPPEKASTPATPKSKTHPPNPQPSPQTAPAQTSHQDSAASRLIRFFKTIAPIIWAIVLILVIVPLAGRWIIAKSILPPDLANHQEISILQPTTLKALDEDVLTAIQTARSQTRTYAKAELDGWMAELDPRMEGFLDWYFDYFTQKRLELSAPLVWAKSTAGNALGFQQAKPGEVVNAKMTKTFQKEFTKRVLVPQTAQLRLEVITTEAAERFVADLSQELEQVQGKYQIPRGQWERYLDTIATTVSDTEGHLSNLSLKTLVSGTGYVAAKPFLMVSMGKLGSKLSAKVGTKMTASATAKVAAKTGTSVAAELGTSLIDPIVGVGILIWDVWDYNHTVAVDRPLLRRNLEGYLESMERSLLDNPETGIMAAVHQLEASVVQGVQHRA